MRATAEITRAALREYRPKLKMKALKKCLIGNGKRRIRPDIQNMKPAIKLLYAAYIDKTKNISD
jgi:hypothetical protein